MQGIMVGGIDTFTNLNLVALEVGTIPSRGFGMAFWVELEEMLGPIFGPIVRGVFEPVWRTLEDPYFRTTILSTIIWTFMIVGGLVFVIHEAPTFLSWITGTQSKTSRKVIQSSAAQRRVEHSAERRAAKVKLDKDREERQAKVDAYGVTVNSRIKRSGDEFLLSVIVNNSSTHQIDMVVVDIDLPADINVSIGSFRMQRLGTISAGQTEIAEFKLRSRGGNLTEIGGYIEFLSASYEISKIPLPPPEIDN